MPREIKKSEFDDWKEHFVTQAFCKYIVTDILEIKEAIGNGVCQLETSEKSIKCYQDNFGQIHGLTKLLLIEFGELEDEPRT